MTEKTSSTWMLFASGASVEVHANSYEAPSGSKRPIDAYVVSDCDGDCEEAAARAVETVWQAVSVQGKRLRPLVFGFDLPGRKAKKPVVGASGGLAFVVCAMQKFSGCDFGNVAATGILQSTDLDAPIGEVRAIKEKLEAALALVPPGGLVLFPEKNDAEVPELLKTRFREKQIRLRSVRDVSQALEILMEDIPMSVPVTSTVPKWLLFAVCGVLTALLVTAGFLYQSEKNTKDALPVVSYPEKGAVIQSPAAVMVPPEPAAVPENAEAEKGDTVANEAAVAAKAADQQTNEGDEVVQIDDKAALEPESTTTVQPEQPPPPLPAAEPPVEKHVPERVQPSRGFD